MFRMFTTRRAARRTIRRRLEAVSRPRFASRLRLYEVTTPLRAAMTLHRAA